jgi:glycosyltransferase involved in cell wall biosynthesis
VKRLLLSVVVPTYNEREVLPEFNRRLGAALASLDMDGEIVYVNDGSADGTREVLDALAEADARVGVLHLSRNFGKEVALTAGLDHAGGDAVVVIDADLQDPPELIPKLVEEWHRGWDVVYAKRKERRGESWVKRATAYAFYRVIQGMSRVRIPEDTGDFRLISRRALDALLALRERHRFMKGLFAWIGYQQTAVLYDREPRYAGLTKWSYWRLWNFAVEGITSFSTAPLKIATYIGLLTAIGAFIYGIFMIYRTLVYGETVQGFPTLIVVILFLGGVQLTSIGMIGEYLARMFEETKNRPLYLVDDYRSARTARNRVEVAAGTRTAAR